MKGIDIIERAVAWWKSHMTTDLRSVSVRRDGYVRFEWTEGSEAGSFHVKTRDL
jgi:hypothetical protein